MGKKKYKTPIKRLEEDLDKLWSKCIIHRDKTCRVTNSDYRLSAHHIRSRQHRYTRWDLDNGLCISWKIHFLQKANPERFQDIIIDTIGDRKYQSLKTKSLKVADHSIEDLEAIKHHLETMLRRYMDGIDFDEIPF